MDMGKGERSVWTWVRGRGLYGHRSLWTWVRGEGLYGHG